jgi:hypothetical protein
MTIFCYNHNLITILGCWVSHKKIAPNVLHIVCLRVAMLYSITFE